MLQYAYDVDRSSNYTTKIKGKRTRDYAVHLHLLKDEINQGFFRRTEALDSVYESTSERPELLNSFLISQTGRGWKTHMMILDLDSEDAKDQAIWDIDQRGHSWCLYQSSPDSFWLFVDVYGTVAELLKICKEIPGVDRDYLGLVKNRGFFTIRAYPRAGVVPEFVESSNKPGSERMQSWIQQFNAYWTSEDMEWIITQLFLNAL